MIYYHDEFFREIDRAKVVGLRTFNDAARTEIRTDEDEKSWRRGANWGDVKAELRSELDRLMAEDGIKAEPAPPGVEV